MSKYRNEPNRVSSKTEHVATSTYQPRIRLSLPVDKPAHTKIAQREGTARKPRLSTLNIACTLAA